MSKNLHEILSAADWKELTPRLLYYADRLIRQCIWRGLPVTAVAGAKLSVEGLGADDVLQEAIERLLNGERRYSYSVSLEQNLRGTIKSLIWSLNKSSRRTPLLEIRTIQKGEQNRTVMAELASSAPSPAASVAAEEAAREQKQILEQFEKFLSCEEDLLKVLEAYKAGHHKPREIEKFSGIPAARISELKRKLRDRMEEFEARAAWPNSK
jgi:DNA-directed RNA polymerase specialized sigma24 family protein